MGPMQLARDAVAPSSDSVQVIYGATEDYVLPALVSIWSMWQNSSQPVEVTLYVENMQQHSLDLIGLARDRLGVPVQGKSFDETGFEEYASQSKGSYPVVSLLPLILPRLVERRCLFIDVDTLVMGDIWELLSADLNGMPIGAVFYGAVRVCGYGPCALGGQALHGESIGSDSSFTCQTQEKNLHRPNPKPWLCSRRALFQQRCPDHGLWGNKRPMP